MNYAFTGFVAPVANLPAINTGVKAGQSVPLKFSLAGNFGLDVMQGMSSTSVEISCVTRNVTGNEQPIIIAAGKSTLAYDSKLSRYQFNWKTEDAWGNTCRRLLLRLDDGTTHSADFMFNN